MFKTDQTEHCQLFAFTPRELLSESSDVWLYLDLFSSLDMEDFYLDYSPQGGEAIDPRLVLRTIFYGLTHGCYSGRKLAHSCTVDLRYMILSGHLSPSYRVFHRFLLRHEKQLIDLFTQIVRLAQKMDLVKLGRLAIDGTSLKAFTSQSRTMKFEKMDLAIEKIKSDIAAMKETASKEANSAQNDDNDEMTKAIKDREARMASIKKAKAALESEAQAEGREVKPTAQKSFNDVDAVSLGVIKSGFIIGYNGQAVVDGEAQIIVAAELHQSATDKRLLPGMLKQTEETCGKVGESVLADAGYFSVANQSSVESHGAQAFIAPTRERHIKGDDQSQSSSYEQLTPLGGQGNYSCLAGKTLPIAYKGSNGTTHIKFASSFCDGCHLQSNCAFYSRRGKRFQIPTEEKRQIFAKMYCHARSDEYKETYKYRKAIVEPVFGNLKYNKALRIYVKGKARVSLWWKMACSAHNIEKIVGRQRLAAASG